MDNNSNYNEDSNLDEIDKMLYEYFGKLNNEEIPEDMRENINRKVSIRIKQINRKRKYYKVRKIAMIIIVFFLFSSGIVFAKDIITYITSIFTNSTEAIDSAVENGYIQEVEDVEYVFDQDIGIKVDYITMDSSNLDVSFVYKDNTGEEYESIKIENFSVKDEKRRYYIFIFLYRCITIFYADRCSFW